MAEGLKVLVVDDSASARTRVRRRLLADPDIAEVDTATDGVVALRKIATFEPDVITMDVQMPRMDGIAALREIMATVPTPVVMLSGLTGEDSATTIRALELGAVDFCLKPDMAASGGRGSLMDDLLAKVKTAAQVRLSNLASADEAAMRMAIEAKLRPASPRPRSAYRKTGEIECLTVIASSTGGPKALAQLIPHLPADLSTGYLLVQHMPAGFTRSLSERLDKRSDLEVREAVEGDKITPGLALMAPGGLHMTISKYGIIHLNDGPTVHGVRPAADITMKSAASAYGDRVTAAVLTGMGSDGRDGVRAIKAVGGSSVVEHESTCAVYGMPRAVAEAGLADKIVPLDQIPRVLTKYMETRFKSSVGAAN